MSGDAQGVGCTRLLLSSERTPNTGTGNQPAAVFGEAEQSQLAVGKASPAIKRITASALDARCSTPAAKKRRSTVVTVGLVTGLTCVDLLLIFKGK